MTKIFVSSFLLVTLGVLTANGLGDFGFGHAHKNGRPFKPTERKPGVYADPEVTIKNGTVSGLVTTNNNGDDIYAYLALPYAEAPVGPLRFKDPRPFQEAWGTEVRDAKTAPPSCPQAAPAGPVSEDCLFLNVYTPVAPGDTTSKLPVIFFIHGGGFSTGDSLMFGGEKLLMNKVVYVSIHYRLGPLGFLSTGDAELPGNFGLKDQVQALRWVQENIGAFGGDPSSVTIFGVSAGSASVMHLMLAPSAKNLFHRAIAASGTAISYWALDREPKTCTEQLAAALACPTGTSKEMVECLRNAPADDVITEFNKIMNGAYMNLEIGNGCHTPVIEPALPGAFLTAEPMELMKAGKVNDVPLIIGNTWHDGSYLLALAYAYNIGPLGRDKDAKWLRNEAIADLLAQFGMQKRLDGGAISESVKVAFFNDGVDMENWDSMMPGLVNMEGVTFIKAAVQRTADILSRVMKSPVYLYNFEQFSENSIWDFYTGGVPLPIEHGVGHGDDMMYFFNMPFPPTESDTAFSKVACRLWYDFARTGNPTPAATPDYPIWPKYDSVNTNFMKLSDQAAVGQDFASTWTPTEFSRPT